MGGYLIKVNEKAPVIARSEIKINAAPETVWNLLTDINNWPKWNPKVKNVNFDGKISIGNSFKWKAGPGSITSTFQEIIPPRRIVWIGKTLGIKGIHVWTLKPQNDKTVVTSQESWEGVIVSIIHGRLQKTLDEDTESALHYLKTAIEST